MTLIIGSTNMGGSKLGNRIKKLWPLPSDSSGGTIAEKAKQVLKTFRERSAAKKLSDARRTKNSSGGGRTAGY